ncbi:hypothetical protein J19TS2_01810 [Cohnella xylanilytica]|nr:hypothetical protein J19TS2_01810 [Cohnella xylanilytica]
MFPVVWQILTRRDSGMPPVVRRILNGGDSGMPPAIPRYLIRRDSGTLAASQNAGSDNEMASPAAPFRQPGRIGLRAKSPVHAHDKRTRGSPLERNERLPRDDIAQQRGLRLALAGSELVAPRRQEGPSLALQRPNRRSLHLRLPRTRLQKLVPVYHFFPIFAKKTEPPTPAPLGRSRQFALHLEQRSYL